MRARTGWSLTRLWGAGGAVLLLCCGGLAWLARDFTYGSDMTIRPIVPVVVLLMGAGLILVALATMLPHVKSTRRLAWWIFAAGAMMRLVMSLSQPILEDDWYRYLWDGAVTAQGINPYSSTPHMAREGTAPELQALATEAGIVLERVNHPELGTIYPPVAQAGFAIAHQMAPWRLGGLRVLHFSVDCGVFALLIVLLGRLDRSPLYVVLYWWNPLVIKECYNSVHMDILVLPFILGALLLAIDRRLVLAAALLAAATAVKIWPVLLLPSLLATQWRTPRRALLAAAVFGGVAIVLVAPMLRGMVLGDQSGLLAYSRRWEMNDALFMLFPWLVEQGTALAGLDWSPALVHRAGRVLAALLVAAVAVYAALAMADHARTGGLDQIAARRRLAGLWCGVAATLFLVSPTQFPWYFVWIAPLLPLVPRMSLLWLTVMLPLYYLKFYYDARGQVDFFHYRVVWLEYAPVWALLLWEWLGKRDNPAGGC